MNLLKTLRNNPFNPKLAVDLMAKTDQEVDQMPPLRLLLVGKTGAGKSTLVNALFREEVASTGVGLPVTQSIQKITKEGVPLVIYDSKGLELQSKSQEAAMQQILQLIQHGQTSQPAAPIHLIYYCINANMARIEPQEIALIRRLSKELPVIVVLTQAIGETAQPFIRSIRNEVPEAKDVVAILAKDFDLAGQVGKVAAYGLEQLIEVTYANIPAEVQRAFINAQRIDLTLKTERSRSWARRYMKTTFGIGLTPLPIADSTLLVPIQITMLAHITSIFGISLDKKQMVSLLAGVGGTGLASMVGKYLASSTAKLIPGIGSLTGGIVNGVTASTVTLALAYAYIEVLKQIALAENEGRKLLAEELTVIMRQSLGDELVTVSHLLPDSAKQALPQWIRDLANKPSTFQ